MVEYLIRDVRLPLPERDRPALDIAARALSTTPRQIHSARFVRRSIDARQGRVSFVVSVIADLPGALAALPAGVVAAPPPPALPALPAVSGNPEIAIVGTGPAGLFAALRLTAAGLRPVLLERGADLTERLQDVDALQGRGVLDPESNFHFGMGGAGTYSDGKLFTRLNHPAIAFVLASLQRHGAGSEEEILVEAHPHVGTDRWPPTLQSLRRELEARGCRFLFHTRVTGLDLREGKLRGLTLTDGIHPCEAALLAPGNSARELFEALSAAGVAILAKPFAVGMRMVHPQERIDRIQYGRHAGHPLLPPATYRLTGTFQGRGVYSFCMCPGGAVLPTPTEEGLLCLNGMSHSTRSSPEANAAMVVTLSPEDLDQPGDPLCGIRFQRTLERAAFVAGGGGYAAPAQSLEGFLRDRSQPVPPVRCYHPRIHEAPLTGLLPPWLETPLKEGLWSFTKKMKGLLDPQAVLLGLETRTSCPVRILRQPDGMSPTVQGLFPAGEGSGFAGGITSSAVDGVRAADWLVQWLVSRP